MLKEGLTGGSFSPVNSLIILIDSITTTVERMQSGTFFFFIFKVSLIRKVGVNKAFERKFIRGPFRKVW